MLYTLRELENKDVVNICNGKMLGHIMDLELESDCGRITAIYINAACAFWNMSKGELRIPWDNIKCIGEDTVLVEYRSEENCECRRNRKNNWWSF